MELYTKSVSLSDRVWVCLDVEYFISIYLHCSIRTQNQGWRGGPALKSNCSLFQTTQIQCPAPSGMMKGVLQTRHGHFTEELTAAGITSAQDWACQHTVIKGRSLQGHTLPWGFYKQLTVARRWRTQQSLNPPKKLLAVNGYWGEKGPLLRVHTTVNTTSALLTEAVLRKVGGYRPQRHKSRRKSS